MLFDLRGKRKRFVQVVYAALAVLFAVSFVGFGIGGDAAGGIFDAFGLGTSSTSPTNPQYEQRIEDAEEVLAANPEDRDALLELASTHALAGNDEAEVNEQTGETVLTEEAAVQYEQAIDAWERYLATNPRNPEGGIAAQLLSVYIAMLQSSTDPSEIEELLNGTVRAAATVAQDQPSSNSYATLAEFAYLAGKEERAKEAEELALEETESAQITQVRRYLEDAKKRGKRLQRQLEQQREATGTSPEEAFQNPFEESTGGGLGGGFTAP